MVRLKGGVDIQERQDLCIMAEPLWPQVCLIPQGDSRCAEGSQPLVTNPLRHPFTLKAAVTCSFSCVSSGSLCRSA